LIQQYKSLKNSTFFDQKNTKGPTVPVDEIDRARRRRAAIYLRRPRSGAWSRRAFMKKSFPTFSASTTQFAGHGFGFAAAGALSAGGGPSRAD
jgi:hypothetical protein